MLFAMKTASNRRGEEDDLILRAQFIASVRYLSREQIFVLAVPRNEAWFSRHWPQLPCSLTLGSVSGDRSWEVGL
jgi:hypothetical protein